MVWGVLVIALAAGILFCSFFTETWARDAGDAAESMGSARWCAQARRLHAVTRWLRVCAVMYLLLGLGADWLCSTLIR